MKLAVIHEHKAVFRLRHLFCRVCFLLTTLCVSSCSLPSLEGGDCSQARDSVKQFYSLYIGTDAEERVKSWERFQKYFSPQFAPDPKTWATDPFTNADSTPKTFKIGVCKALDPEKVNLQVQLYWREETKTVQKEVHVEAVKSGDAWLINKVSN